MKKDFQPNIAVVTAWRPELDALHSMVPNATEVALPRSREDIRYYHGNIYNRNIVYFESGVGATDSAISTSDVLSRYPTVKNVIVAGVAGSLSPDIEIASVVIPQRWYDYSRQLYARPGEDGYRTPEHMGRFLQGSHFGMIHPMNTKPVYVNEDMARIVEQNTCSFPVDNNVVIGGSGLSASIFLDNPDYRMYLGDIYPDATIVDMESYAILRATQRHANNVSGIAFRTVSDTAGKEGTSKNELSENLKRATGQLTLFLDHYLHLLSQNI